MIKLNELFCVMNISQQTNFEQYFKLFSYLTVVCGALSLFVTGAIGYLEIIPLLAVLILCWNLENSKFQFSEKFGVILIFLIVPLFYLDWKFHISGLNSREAIAASNLARLILLLAAIKFLQKKTDRDWIFIYLISFFQILLAAGVGITPLFLICLTVYLFFALCAVILLEVRKSSRNALVKSGKSKGNKIQNTRLLTTEGFRKFPVYSFYLLLMIAVFAVPLFLILPRVSGAGFGNSLGGLTGLSGFSDSVRLGEIGKIQQGEATVMRVRLEPGDENKVTSLRWRGVALDTFDNQTWRKSRRQFNEPLARNDRDFFIFDAASDSQRIVTQTVYLEPLSTPTLFALSKPVAIQGKFQLINVDSEGALESPNQNAERITYKVFSDISVPNIELLKTDKSAYPQAFQRYLRLPVKLDPRIGELARSLTEMAGAANRYDQAKAVERYLQNNFGYTLEMKASGEQPLADFLFNVREGHCEYFATAMAVMLRTQGIATRVVNGFQQGEYNETAGVYVIKQKNAHSWVEVYFPEQKVWITFDPTPVAQMDAVTGANSVMNRFSKFVEALETFWIQYIVTYDNQEQRTLFRLVKKNLDDYKQSGQQWLSNIQSRLKEWWQNARGDAGLAASLNAVGMALVYLGVLTVAGLISFFVFRKLSTLELWKRFKGFWRAEKQNSVVLFYEQMLKVLAEKGFSKNPYQTPFEFAHETKIPEAVKITEIYNRVRFGEKPLSDKENLVVEQLIEKIKNG